MDTSNWKVSAMVIADGKIIEVGDDQHLIDKYGDATSLRRMDAQGKFIMPGLIEGHGHFHGVGEQEVRLNFLTDTSWARIIEKVEAAAASAADGAWIIGRGWHQEKLSDLPLNQVDGYPRHDLLSKAAPDHPVLLTHASGHGIIVNKRAMEMADITQETSDPLGGRIVRDESGNAIGVFEERAVKTFRVMHADYENTRSKKRDMLSGYKLRKKLKRRACDMASPVFKMLEALIYT